MPQLTEQTGFILLMVGLILLAIGYLWLVVRAFRSSTWWGLVVMLLPPFGGLFYAVAQARRALGPAAVALLGLLVAASPIAINRLVPTKKVEIKNITTGETDLTITGLTRYDYASLSLKTDLTVLQMANPDVTDVEINYIRGLIQLKRLDLSDTAITDAAMDVLASLPALEDLKLARTKITDDGVKKLLAEAKRLRAIDARGTDVKTSTLRDWKNADKDHRNYLK